MAKDKKFDFPTEIEEALINLEHWPRTERGAVPPWPTSWFIVTENEKKELTNIINTLGQVSSKVFAHWTDDEKHYYSILLNSAERVLHNSLSREPYNGIYNGEGTSLTSDTNER